jgi:hypothetical protein
VLEAPVSGAAAVLLGPFAWLGPSEAFGVLGPSEAVSGAAAVLLGPFAWLGPSEAFGVLGPSEAFGVVDSPAAG